MRHRRGDAVARGPRIPRRTCCAPATNATAARAQEPRPGGARHRTVARRGLCRRNLRAHLPRPAGSCGRRRDLAIALPPSVRWLPAADAPPRDETLDWYRLPRGSAGALLCAWRAPGESNPSAMSLEVLTDRGARLAPRWRRTYGPRTGRVFTTRESPSNARIHVAEGELDALALVHAPWTGPGTILASGGTAGMRHATAQSWAAVP